MKAISRSGDTDNSPKSVTVESSTVSEGQEQSWGLDDDYVLPGAASSCCCWPASVTERFLPSRF